MAKNKNTVAVEAAKIKAEAAEAAKIKAVERAEIEEQRKTALAEREQQTVTICGIRLYAPDYLIAVDHLRELQDAIESKVDDGTNAGQTIRHRTIRQLYQCRADKSAAVMRYTVAVCTRGEDGKPVLPLSIDRAKQEALLRENRTVARLGIKLGANTGANVKTNKGKAFVREVFKLAIEATPSLKSILTTSTGSYVKGESDYPDHTSGGAATTEDQLFGVLPPE